jgi:hypothetical protein
LCSFALDFGTTLRPDCDEGPVDASCDSELEISELFLLFDCEGEANEGEFREILVPGDCFGDF